ncbi:unnamed protein product [Allacma fusca]|uniref:Uncharacterized protein n=1 Tax=Allacma fusca TaxID=39272 RepID=A0A8J2LCK7_9HEXA|nr:unnamed protein product [Allacma fusca]
MGSSFRALVVLIVAIVASFLSGTSRAEIDSEDNSSSPPVVLSLGEVIRLPSDSFLNVEHLVKRAFWDRVNRDSEDEYEYDIQSKRNFWDRGMNSADKKAFWDRSPGAARVDKKAFWERSPSKRAFWDHGNNPKGKRAFWDRVSNSPFEDNGKRAFWDRVNGADKKALLDQRLTDSDQPTSVNLESKRNFWDRAIDGGSMGARDKRAFWDRGFSDRDTRAEKPKNSNRNRQR